MPCHSNCFVNFSHHTYVNCLTLENRAQTKQALKVLFFFLSHIHPSIPGKDSHLKYHYTNIWQLANVSINKLNRYSNSICSTKLLLNVNMYKNMYFSLWLAIDLNFQIFTPTLKLRELNKPYSRHYNIRYIHLDGTVIDSFEV